jgi:Short C-terminal domain
VIALASMLTTWVHRQLLDSATWRSSSLQLIQDPVVRNTIATQLVDQLYNNVNVAAELQSKLPTTLKPLAGPAAGALQEPATKAVEFLLAQPRFQQVFVGASAVAHDKLVDVLEDRTGHGIRTGHGVVTLDAKVLLKEIGTDLGLPVSVLDRLPPDAGVFTIMNSRQLALAQDGIRTLRVLSVWLLVLALVLFAVALWLARGERRRTLAHIGWALVVVGLFTVITRGVLGDYVIDAVVPIDFRVAGHHVWSIETVILGQIGWETLFYGAVIVIGATLAGPSRVATAVRRRAAPVLNMRPGVTWGSFAVVYGLLVLGGGTHALRTWWGIILLGALLAAGVVVLRRQTLREFPLAGTAHEGPTMGARVAASASHAAHRVRGSVPHTGVHTGTRSLSDELTRLVELRDSGTISSEEFEQAKKIALSSAPGS